jgi:hypothetical protein
LARGRPFDSGYVISGIVPSSVPPPTTRSKSGAGTSR